MVDHAERLALARSAIRYICIDDADRLATPVPNCPGWTVYNAAVHIGRVGIAWQSMIEATPDDPDSRTRGYADAESRGSGHNPDVLASWALSAIDALDADLDRPCYFSMTGGHGTVELWGRHVATELGIHRLDIEAALGEGHAISSAHAVDALQYSCAYFLPAMRSATSIDPGSVSIQVADGELTVGTVELASETSASVELRGSGANLLLAMWGRPHEPIDITGSTEVLEGWRALPGQAFQFGTWD